MSLTGGISDSRANPKGILVLREYNTSDVRSGNKGPNNTRAIFVVDLTTADGLFSAGRFAINSQDTVLVTESPINKAASVLNLIGSVFGIVGSVNNVSN